ncbi:MAG: hypothetical protein AAGA72_07880 [Pseudomonadota bacterium]
MNRLQSGASPHPSQPAFDARWKRLTVQANADLNAGDLEAAGAGYDQAYQEARIIFAEAWNGYALAQPHAPPMLIVSATNAAQQRRAKGNQTQAEDQILAAIRIFTEAMTSARAPDVLKRGCAEHLPRLLTHVPQRQSETQSMIDEAKSAALAYWKKSAH